MDRVRGALPGTVGVDVGAVANNHLYPRVRAQPRRERGGVPIRQQVHHRAALEIHQDGPVAMAFAPRPLVHAQHPGHRAFDVWDSNREPQESVGGNRHGQAVSQPPAGFAAQGQGDVALNVGEALGAAGGWPDDTRQALGEGALWATGLHAQEPAHLEPEDHRPALSRQVGQPALVAAMHARGGHGAPWAWRRWAPGPDEDRDAVGLRPDVLDGEPVRDQGEEAFGHGELDLLRCSPHVLIRPVPCHRHHAKCGRIKPRSALTRLTANSKEDTRPAPQRRDRRLVFERG